MAFTNDQNNTPTPAQDDATGVDLATFTQNGAVQDDATGVDLAITGIAQDDMYGPGQTQNLRLTKNLLGNLADPSAARLRSANLLRGGAPAEKNTNTRVTFGSGSTGGIAHDNDWRVRITLGQTAKIFYQDDAAASNIMAPLIDGGVIFPYTPEISVTHSANWQPQKLTHSNYNTLFYENSEVQAISIGCDFTVQNIEEGQYFLAVLYFFRAATKMFFGRDALAGNPPPIVFLDGYGSHYFPHVPCVITSFQHTMPQDVDYVEVPSVRNSFGDYSMSKEYFLESTRLPTASKVAIQLQPIYSRNSTHKNFTLGEFARGDLIKGRGGFI